MRVVGRIVVGAIACGLIRWGAYDNPPWLVDLVAVVGGIMLLDWTSKDRAR